MRVKCSDIVSYMLEDSCCYGEIGPGRKRDNDVVWYEVYPVQKASEHYAYASTPVWVAHTWIRQHFSVRKVEDFHKAWIAFGFNPVVDADDIVFELLFDEPITHETPLETDTDMLETDDDESLRSADTYSTMLTESEDSFIAESEQHEHEHECDCEYCDATKQSVRWFDREWKPTDETERKVKTFIEYLEQKYTA